MVYGVNTGYGDSCTVADAAGAGRGAAAAPVRATTAAAWASISTPHETRAVLAARLKSLAQGVSGVRVELLERLAAFLNHDVLPRIPAEGSVGASGDLTPLSYVAAALVRRARRAVSRARVKPAARRWRELGRAPLELAPEGRPGAHERHRGDDGARLPGLRARRLPDRGWPPPHRAVDVLALRRQRASTSTSAVRRQAARRASSASPRWIRADLRRRRDDRARRAASAGPLLDPLRAARDRRAGATRCRGCAAMIENELNSANDNPHHRRRTRARAARRPLLRRPHRVRDGQR